MQHTRHSEVIGAPTSEDNVVAGNGRGGVRTRIRFRWRPGLSYVSGKGMGRKGKSRFDGGYERVDIDLLPCFSIRF